MTSREWLDPLSGTSPVAHSGSASSALPLPLLVCPSDSFWERWCSQATPEQLGKVLHRAATTGLVHAHQLPAANLSTGRSRLQGLLSTLLSGGPHQLDTVGPAALSVHDGELDDDQQHAVARAVASPDVSLIQGYPGSGKSRVVAEVIRQVTAAGQRLLFVAPSSAALDCVLARLHRDLAPVLLRHVAANETVDDLRPAVAPLTLVERLRSFEHRTLPAARQRIAELRQRLDHFAAQEAAWLDLRGLPNRIEAAVARTEALARQRDELPALVEQLWADKAENRPEAFTACIDELHRAEQDLLRQIDEAGSRLGQLAGEAERIDRDRQQLTSHPAARPRKSWWAPAWWQGRPQPDLAVSEADLQAQADAVAAEQAALAQRKTELLAAQIALQADHAQQRQKHTEAEIGRRSAALEQLEAAAAGELASARAAWVGSCEALGLLPSQAPADLEQAHELWQAQRSSTDRDLVAWQAWLDALEQVRPALPRDLVASCRVLAVPLAELLSLPAERTPAGFDVLIVEEAHRLTERDLLAVSRLAPRCVLVGEAAVEIPLPVSHRRPTRPGDGWLPAPFSRLWNTLHCDPRKSSACWRESDGKLIARLAGHGDHPDAETRVHREPLYDRPDIELVIASSAAREPRIVEVCFPASMGIREAREFIYRELQELAVDCPGTTFRWAECDETVRLVLASGGSPEVHDRVSLEPGVHEALTCVRSRGTNEAAWQTIEIVFDAKMGWDRGKAQAWVAERLGLRDLGRTAALSRCHRAQSPLSTALLELLFSRSAQPGSAEERGQAPPIELIAVPPAHHEQWDDPGRPDVGSVPSGELRRSGGTATLAPRPLRTRGGAGLELDLADNRRADGLPSELRGCLPSRGLVNLAEARLVVHALETLLLDPASQSLLAGRPADEPQIAVLSLHAAQVSLLRLLIERSPVLTDSGVRIVVGLPGCMAHRESPLVCLSLTRSHSTRAVPFSEDPRDLVLALTRASRRLLVFGDPGTMTRRSLWFGSLDHLGESAGPLEQAVVTQLLTHLPERETPASPARARESSSA